MKEFNEYLNSNGLRSTIRWSRGDGNKDARQYEVLFSFFIDILAACGQLRSSKELKQSSLIETE